MFYQMCYEGIFILLFEQGMLVFLGNLGMFEWGGIFVDLNCEVVIVNLMVLLFVLKLILCGFGNLMEQLKDVKGMGMEFGIQLQYGVLYGVMFNLFFLLFGLLCKQLVWGYILVLDLKINEVVWKKCIGMLQDSMLFLMLVLVLFNMGMLMLGGLIFMVGNVLFIVVMVDNYLCVYNMSNGEKLWQGCLLVGGQVMLMIYEVNGKQYVVIFVGGYGLFGMKMGDYIVVYVLLDDVK